MHYIINRATWRCGGDGELNEGTFHGEGTTSLLNNEGYMCCLGQCMVQEGIREFKLLNYSEPNEVDIESNFVRYIDTTHYVCNELANDAIQINDNYSTTLEQKERLLIELFKKHGHTLEFSGDYEN